MLLNTMTGHETWQGWSAKVHVFHTPKKGEGREQHIGIAARDPTLPNLTETRNDGPAPARPGMRADLGSWTSAVYDVPPGSVFKIFAQRSGPVRQANMFIQMRAEAALQRVIVRLSQNQQAAFSAVQIMGRFDLLTWDEATELGYATLQQFKPHFEQSMVSRMFEVQLVEAAQRARPVVETRVVAIEEGGETVEVVVPSRRRGRALKL